MIRIEKSANPNLEELKSLLLQNDLPVDDIEESAVQFFIARSKDEIVGTIGLEHYNDTGLLRSLAVQDKWKNQSVGSRLLEHLLEYCRESQIRKIYLLTTTAEGYFKKFGFDTIDRGHTPDCIKKSKEFSDICPATAVVMEKDLTI